jgi:hypothetical protein
LTIVFLLLLDVTLARHESRLEDEAWLGELRNAPGPAIADATRFMLLDTPPERRERAIAMVGSSVTFGPRLAPDETISAQLARWLAEKSPTRPVFNLAQPGGNPHTPIPVAAAFGTHPVSLLLVELLVPSYAEHEAAPLPALSTDEIAMLGEASPMQVQILRRCGASPSASERIETALTSVVRRASRLYRLRGSLWWDSDFTPTYLVWSLRREISEAGFLPKRFQGQSTNVGRLPWRKAYVGGQRPGANQGFDLPTAALSEPNYAELRCTAELARAAGVPVIFFELPLNLEFQRTFNLMQDQDFTHLNQVRRSLIERMLSDGLDFLPAPELPEDGFLDKAHLTPLGARILAQHLGEAVLRQLSAGTKANTN